MKKFLKNVFIIISIFVLTLSLAVIWDPFRVFRVYKEYYNENYIESNRENICYNLFIKNKEKTKINSIIIGSSRSKAFKTENWKNIIESRSLDKNKKNRYFHFDGSGLGLYRANKLIHYLDKEVDSIKNIILVVDTDFFNEIEAPKGHLFIQPTAISNESSFSFYKSFFLASIDPSFLISNLIFSITKKHYGFMKDHIIKSDYFSISNNETGDNYYGYDQEISIDSVGFYKKLDERNVFYTRTTDTIVSPTLIKEEQKKIIGDIKSVLENNKTNIRVIVSPLYNQKYFNKEDLRYLREVFGTKNVHDFSGKNVFTNNIQNYYERSHFKPYIATKILEKTYGPL